MSTTVVRIRHSMSECRRSFASSPDLLGLYAVGKDPAHLLGQLPGAIRARLEIGGPVPGLSVERAPDQEGFDSCWSISRS